MVDYTKLRRSNLQTSKGFYMEKLTVTRVYNDKITTQKYGIKDKISIYTEEYPETKMSSLDKSAQGIKVGDVIEATIEKNGPFTNFKMPKAAWGSGSTSSPVSPKVEERLKRLEDAVFKGVEPANVLAEDEPVF